MSCQTLPDRRGAGATRDFISHGGQAMADEKVHEPETSLDLTTIDYPTGFYNYQSPVHLNFICAIYQTAGPKLDGGFTYCELGCGPGETTNVLAASDDRGEFYGLDLSQSHIDFAKSVAQKGGLGNVRFIHADIRDFDPADLPDFDFVTMHGLYSWVPPAVQEAVIKFLDAKLKPGGIVYVSYNAMPGWGSAGPIRRYFIDAVERLGGDILDKVPKVLDELASLREKGAAFFVQNPVAAQVLEQLRGVDVRYFVHEFLSSNWNPRYFADVSGEMKRAGLDYIGDASIFENLPELTVPPDCLGILREIQDQTGREMATDFFVNRMFRSDVYIRDISPGRSPNALDETLIGMTRAPMELRDVMNVRGEEKIDLRGPLLDRLTVLLEDTAMTVAELQQDEVLKGCPPSELFRGIVLLACAGNLHPFASRESRRSDSDLSKIRVVPACNRTLLDLDRENRLQALASPIVGTGIHVSALEALLLRGLELDDPVSFVWDKLQKRGSRMMRDRKEIESDEENIKAIRGALGEFRAKKLPKLTYLGIAE